MKCPIDDTTLTITERQGVEIDYCPTCRGVWLDRGELDKIIERADQFTASRPMHSERHNDDRRDQDHSRDERRHFDDESHHGGHDGHRKPHKKESFMSDLFDF